MHEDLPATGQAIRQEVNDFKSILADDEGYLQAIHGFPSLATMSIMDEFENTPSAPQLKMNENSQALQNGFSAVIAWNQALNCPDSVTEIISLP